MTAKDWEHLPEGCEVEDCPCYAKGYDQGIEAMAAAEEREADALREELDALRSAVLVLLPPWNENESIEIHNLRMAVTR